MSRLLRTPSPLKEVRWKRMLVTSLTLSFLLVALCQIPSVRADEPAVKILGIQTPPSVHYGETFDVTVQVAYSARYGMMDIGIWDMKNGTVQQEVVSNTTLSGPGMSTYTLNLKAPNASMVWHLAAITRVWLQDSWYYDQAGELDFSVTVTDQAYLQLGGLPTNLSLTVDGKVVEANTSMLLVPMQIGPHSLEVSSIIGADIGKRLIFAGWSDGIDSNPRIIVLSDNLTLTPIYKTQYLLNVSSDEGQTQGGGWYWAGNNATACVLSTRQIVTGALGVSTGSYEFAGWSGVSNTRNSLTSISMSGPGQLKATWIYTVYALGVTELAATIVLLIGCVILIARAMLLYQRTQKRIHRAAPFAILSISIIVLIAILPANVAGQIPTPTTPSIVAIGDASWYYWARPSSDACVFWLGGGLEYSQGGYLINPYEYESFGTIRFLQDLTKYYCLLVLQKGSSPSQNLVNRTIFQEPIQGQPTIGREVHNWLIAQGYKHVVMTGYSVGAEAAASIATGDPGEWTATDGLVLITARLPPNVVGGAPMLNTNLMLLYGHAPTFEPSGQEFYQLAPTEGWHGSEYLHKEYHVLDQMSHEVWSPLKDNTYSPTLALGDIVKFIQTSAALQFGRLNSTNNLSLTNSAYLIQSVKPPPEIMPGSPFFLSASLSGTVPPAQTNGFALLAFDYATMLPLTSTQLPPNPASQVQLLVPAIANSSHVKLLLLVVMRAGPEWVPASPPFTLEITASDELQLTVSGLVGNSSVSLDDHTYLVPSKGYAQVNVSIGTHVIEVQQFVGDDNVAYIFVAWNDGNASNTRSLTITQDTELAALYRAQYFANVTSMVGTPEGSGWYDANSTMVPTVAVCASPSYAFQHWTASNITYSAGDPIPINKPMNVEAIWTESMIGTTTGDYILLISALAFSVLLLLTLSLRSE